MIQKKINIDAPSFEQCSLYLHPEPHDYSATDNLFLINALQKINFITNKIEAQKTGNAYFTGNKFLDYIAYMGCAPAIQFEAGKNNEHFCFIKIHRYKSAQLIHSQKQARAPHCPNCEKPVKNWQNTKTDSTINCGHCGTTSGIEEFNWRKTAGYARLFIEITDIFPREAIPQQLLLDKLTNITDVKWLYFYSCQ